MTKPAKHFKFINQTDFGLHIKEAPQAATDKKLIPPKKKEKQSKIIPLPGLSKVDSDIQLTYIIELDASSFFIKSNKKLAFPISTGYQFIAPQDIVYASVVDNVTIVHLQNKKKIKLTKSLSWVENLLVKRGFCRVHHSYLINFDHINEYIRQDGGYIIMSDKKLVSVARRRREDFLNHLELWNKI